MKSLTAHQVEMLLQLIAARGELTITHRWGKQDMRTARSIARRWYISVNRKTKMDGARFSYGYRAIRLGASVNTLQQIVCELQQTNNQKQLAASLAEYGDNLQREVIERALSLNFVAPKPKMIEIHTVEVVARDADDNTIPGCLWTIVSAEPEADIVERFTREKGGEFGGSVIYRFTAHRLPGTNVMIEEGR